ncbi:MAG: hypothetical protein IJ776_04975 [Paludibacteraceae bacterium]|nr:hypothetical protein [Paludibacteraceae bacterium]
MKKALFILFFVLSTIVQAQDFPRHYLQFNIGDNYLNSAYSGTNTYNPVYANVPQEPCICDNSQKYYPLSWFPSYIGTYTSYEATVPVTFSLQYFYSLKPWLQLGGDIYYAGDYQHISERGSGKLLYRNFNTQISVLPSIRFQFFNRPLVGMYAGLATGVYINLQRHSYTATYKEYHFAWQATFFGLRVGNRAFWTLELGAGHKGFITTGVGVRF